MGVIPPGYPAAGWVTTGSTRTPDCLQRLLRARFRQQVSASVRPLIGRAVVRRSLACPPRFESDVRACLWGVREAIKGGTPISQKTCTAPALPPLNHWCGSLHIAPSARLFGPASSVNC